jgi:hypothetical protein
MKFFGKTYLFPTPNNGLQMIGVAQGLGDATCIVAYKAPSGARRRIKSNRLPAMSDPARLQAHLDIWAAQRKLQEVT